MIPTSQPFPRPPVAGAVSGKRGCDDPFDLGRTETIHQRAGTNRELQSLAGAVVERGRLGDVLVERLQHGQEAAAQEPVGDRASPLRRRRFAGDLEWPVRLAGCNHVAAGA